MCSKTSVEQNLLHILIKPFQHCQKRLNQHLLYMSCNTLSKNEQTKAEQINVDIDNDIANWNTDGTIWENLTVNKNWHRSNCSELCKS